MLRGVGVGDLLQAGGGQLEGGQGVGRHPGVYRLIDPTHRRDPYRPRNNMRGCCGALGSVTSCRQAEGSWRAVRVSAATPATTASFSITLIVEKKISHDYSATLYSKLFTSTLTVVFGNNLQVDAVNTLLHLVVSQELNGPLKKSLCICYTHFMS